MNITTGKTLSRRRMLRGAGALLGLPLLEAMVPLRAAQVATRPTRYAFLFFPNGVRPGHWTPKGEGTEFALSPILQPLAQHQKHLNILTHLWNANAYGGDGHYVKTSGWLTSTTITKTTGADLRSGGPSVDQVLARHLEGQTRFRSLELGIDPVTSGIDRNVNYTRLYGSHISWADATTPLPAEIDPRQAFDRMFRSGNRLNQHRSVLDLVKDDAKRLQNELGTGDRRKVDEYLQSVRELEQRIAKEQALVDAGERVDPLMKERITALDRRIKQWGDDPETMRRLRLDRSGDPTEHVRIMMDLMATAFWTDSTRVSTFMFGNAVSNRNFSFLEGAHGSHHQNSHHQNKKEKLATYLRINQWHSEQFAYLLDRMASLPEANGSLLDNSMLLFGSGLRDGNRHQPTNLPLVLAGGGGGRLVTGQHLVYPEKTPLSRLYLTMLQEAGVKAKRFVDGESVLPGLLG